MNNILGSAVVNEMTVQADDAHADLVQKAVEFQKAGEFSEAKNIYKSILDTNPAHFEALHMSGVLHAQKGEFEQAESWLKRALQHDPQSAGANNNLGNVYKLLKRNEEALACYEIAVKSEDDRIALDSFQSTYTILNELGRFEEIVRLSKNTIDRFPQSPGIYNCASSALINLFQYAEALTYSQKAIDLYPDYLQAYINSALALAELSRPQEALKICMRALELGSEEVDVHCITAAVLVRLGRFAEALAHAEKALVISPGSAVAHNNAATALALLHKYDESLKQFDHAIAAAPDEPEYKYAQASIYMLLGDYGRGFENYEARLLSKKLQSSIVLPKYGHLNLTSLDMAKGKRILVYPEQGLGDVLHFLRYLPLLAQIAGEVHFQAPTALFALLDSSFSKVGVVCHGDPLPLFDYHCSIVSLPYIFRTTLQTVPSPVPYLYADPRKCVEMRQRLSALSGLKVGLVWAGNPNFKNDHIRSTHLKTLEPLLSTKGVSFVSLQKEIPERDVDFLKSSNILSLNSVLADFSDTAALVDCMDLVIATDTSVPHLAGAMGKPLWMLLGSHADWRWGLTDRCPWYPTARLFRQKTPNDWSGVMDAVAGELNSYRGRGWVRKLFAR